MEVRKKPAAALTLQPPRGTAAPAGRYAPVHAWRERRAVRLRRRARLTATEQAARQRALVEQQRDAAEREAERREQGTISILSAAEEARRRETEARKTAEEDADAPTNLLLKRLTPGGPRKRRPPPRKRGPGPNQARTQSKPRPFRRPPRRLFRRSRPNCRQSRVPGRTQGPATPSAVT